MHLKIIPDPCLLFMNNLDYRLYSQNKKKANNKKANNKKIQHLQQKIFPLHFVSQYLIYFLACSAVSCRTEMKFLPFCLLAYFFLFGEILHLWSHLSDSSGGRGRSFKFRHTALYTLDDSNLPKNMRNVQSLFLFKSLSFHWNSQKDWRTYGAWDTFFM